MKKTLNSRGFTIVEMLVATAVFSTVLLLCAIAAVQVGRTFYKGTVVNRVQDTARKVAEDVTQAIQFAPDVTPLSRTGGGGATLARCIGDIRYTYSLTSSLGTAGGQRRHILWKDRISGTVCDTSGVNLDNNTPSAGGKELLGNTMRISLFDVTQTANGYRIVIRVGYGENNVFTDATYTRCRAQNLGGQFCSVSDIETFAGERL